MHDFPFKESNVNIYNVYILTPVINCFYYFCDNNYYFLLFQKLNFKKDRKGYIVIHKSSKSIFIILLAKYIIYLKFMSFIMTIILKKIT